MGGAFSKPLNNTNKKSLYEEIDLIAADYILTSDFKSLTHLKEKEYCNKLVVLTSDILEKYLEPKDIVFLQQKMKKGIEQPINSMLKDRVAFLKEEEMGGLNVQNSVKKKRLCIGIAKQYVRVAHIFASIVTAINPVYKFTDEQGVTQRVPLYKKDEIPANVKTTLERFNICENRIKALQGSSASSGADTGEPIIVAPSICQTSLKPGGETKSLTDEPGIPELMQLYYDKYDYSTGEFVGMTEKTKKVYQAHVDIFNAAFSGATESDPNIKEFADIKLRDYNKKAYCDGNAITSQKQYSSEHVTEEERVLFTNYAEHVKEMVANANKNQSELLSVVHELFTPFVDAKSKTPNKVHYKVNSHLNDVALEKLVRKTRDLIVKLFSTCEKDYETGVKLYEAIVNTVVIKTTDAQIENMNEVKTGLLGSTKAEPVEPPGALEPVLGLKPEEPEEPSILSSLNPFAEPEEKTPTVQIDDRTTSSLIEEENKLLTPESPELNVIDEKRDEYGNATVEEPVATVDNPVEEPTVEPTAAQEPTVEPTAAQEPTVEPVVTEESTATVEPVGTEALVENPISTEEPTALSAEEPTVESLPKVDSTVETPVVLNKEEEKEDPLLKKEVPVTSGGRNKRTRNKRNKKTKNKKNKRSKGRKTKRRKSRKIRR
jgi:hypothetical protein